MATYNPIQSITLTANTNTVTFSGIPQNYTDLEIVVRARSSYSSNSNFYYRINGDTSSSYTVIRLQGNGSTAVSNSGSSNTVGYIGYVDAADSTEGIFGATKIYVNNYSNSNTYKTLLSKGATPGTSGYAAAFVNLYRGSTSPVTSISLTPDAGNWVSGSTFSLYGIKAGSPKAIGGDITTTDGTYWYHAFKNSGIFTVQQGSSLTADVLAVAGGGAGFFGGGGAGGVLYTASQSFLPSSSYTVTVGAGGATPDPQTANTPVSGNDSLVTGGVSLSLRAYGGGGGGVYPTLPQGATGANGGSGGGAGAAGTDMSSSSSSGTNGGIGTNTYSSWLTATGLGVSGYIAGGGGGRGFSGRGTGGTGGGGNGDQANSSQGSAGTANTGGGGGGGYSFAANGYAGGSGLVIVRYAV